MQVKDIMTSDVEIVHPDSPVSKAAEKMQTADTGVLPVGKDGQLAGILTDRDIVLRGMRNGGSPEDTAVRDVLTGTARTVREDQEVEDAARLMAELQVRRLPVVDADEKLVGMISLADLARNAPAALVGDTLKAISQRPETDA